MKRIFIGIPVLNRLDLLERAVAAIDYPADVLIINNNSVDPEFVKQVEVLGNTERLQVLHQEKNMGVAASWNLIISAAFKLGHEWVFIGSNDTFLHHGSLSAAINLRKDSAFGVWHLHAFDFFLLHSSTIEKVGWFDENFYPAYKEDQDYMYRCCLAGVQRMDIPGCSADHVRSATISSNRKYQMRNCETHTANLNYYVEKWGGDAGHELFSNPYGDVRYGLRFWRTPDSTLQGRDWDTPR